MPNYNPKTRTPYGIVSASTLHPELVDALLYVHGFDRSYATVYVDLVNDHKYSEDDYHILNAEAEELNIAVALGEEFDLEDGENPRDYDEIDFRWSGDLVKDYEKAQAIVSELDSLQEKVEFIEIAEPDVVGEYEGVSYASTWLGGALNFFILHSPFVTDKARKGSFCVPGAGVIDTLDGATYCYDVPVTWRVGEA